MTEWSTDQPGSGPPDHQRVVSRSGPLPHPGPKHALALVRTTFQDVGQENSAPPDKTAGQSTWSAPPSLKGVCGCEVEPHHTPLRGATDPEPPPEPTDEELWLADIATQVETDARPLFAATWIWLHHRALELDENEEPA